MLLHQFKALNRHLAAEKKHCLKGYSEQRASKGFTAASLQENVWRLIGCTCRTGCLSRMSVDSWKCSATTNPRKWAFRRVSALQTNAQHPLRSSAALQKTLPGSCVTQSAPPSASQGASDAFRCCQEWAPPTRVRAHTHTITHAQTRASRVIMFISRYVSCHVKL